MRTKFAAALALAAAAGAPATAQAATTTVYAGPPPGVKLADGADLNGFYRKHVKVTVGDTVRFQRLGFHTVSVLGKGASAPPFITPSATSKYEGFKDAAGQDFWFNGQPRLEVGQAAIQPQGDGKFNGRELEYSGLHIADGPAPAYDVKMTRHGTYTVLCQIHPSMKGKITVLKRGKRKPSKSANKKTALKEARSDAKKAAKLMRFKPESGVVHAGHDRGAATVFAFFPQVSKVKAGQSLRFFLDSRSEIHNAAFGPADYRKSIADQFFTPVNTDGPPSAFKLDPRVVFPSDPSLPPLTSKLHGNGFLSTGILDSEAETPNPREASVIFGEAGTFEFECLVHPGMKATVEVSA